jgi:hypothetical protein
MFHDFSAHLQEARIAVEAAIATADIVAQNDIVECQSFNQLLVHLHDGSERHYLVLRRENGRIVYAEFNTTPGQALPEREAKLSLVPGRSPEIAVVKQMVPLHGHGRIR